MQPAYPRYHGVDLLRVILVCGVAAAHAGLMTGHDDGWLAIFGLGILRSVVPAFAVVSGYGVYQTVRRDRLKGWTIGLLLLYLIWCVIYAPLWLRDVGSVADLVRMLIMGPAHLWYIAALLQSIALMLVLFALIPDRRRATRAILLIAVAFALLDGVVQYGVLLQLLDPGLAVFHSGLFYLFPFVAMGYLLAHVMDGRGRDVLPPAPWLWLGVIVLSVLRLVEATYFASLPSGDKLIAPEFPLLAYAYPLVVVLAFMRLRMPQPNVDLVTLSAMIYLMHLGVIVAVMYAGVNDLWVNFAASVLIPSVLVVATPGSPWMGFRQRKRATA